MASAMDDFIYVGCGSSLGSRFMYLLFVLLSLNPPVTFALVTTTVTVDPWTDLGDDASYFCTPSGGSFRELRWKRSATSASAVADATLVMQYTVVTDDVRFDASVDASHYQFNATADNQFKILSVTLDDEERYWCELKVAAQDDAVDSAVSRIRVPPGLGGNVSFSGEDWNIPVGGNAAVEAGSTISVNITMRGVKPAVTTITCSVSESTVIISNEVITSQPNVADNRLFDTTGTADITFPASPLTCTLTCTTPNRQTGDSSGVVQFNITLEVVKAGAGCLFYRLDVMLACLLWITVNGLCT